MTSPSLNKEREAFEAWYVDFYREPVPPEWQVAHTWMCWRAAWEAGAAATPFALPVEGADHRLHNAIMNLPCKWHTDEHYAAQYPDLRHAYLHGHRDARHAAAELAIVGTPSKEGAGQVDLVERLKQEAQIHAQEARTANATIAEIYQIVTGSTGEPGNWNGAEPVRKCIEELRAKVAASPSEGGGEPTDAMVAAAEAAFDRRDRENTKPGPEHVRECFREAARAVLSLSPLRGEAVDAARLDWLDENPNAVVRSAGYRGAEDSWSYRAAHGGNEDALTIREAIDAARNAQGDE